MIWSLVLLLTLFFILALRHVKQLRVIGFATSFQEIIDLETLQDIFWMPCLASCGSQLQIRTLTRYDTIIPGVAFLMSQSAI